MNLKKEYIFLLAVIIGASLYLYFKDTDRLNYQLPELAELNLAAIDTIEISRPNQNRVFVKKQDGQWQIQPEGYPVDETQIDKMLTTASKLTLSTMVATSANYDRYGLSPENAITVNISGQDGAVSRRIDIGKKTTSHNHTFVKVDDDPNVYHADGRLETAFDKTVARLRDKTVLAFNVDDIRNITIVNRGKTIALEKQLSQPDDEPETETGAQPEMMWVTAQGKAADADTIAVLLEDLSTLECREFLSEEEKDGLAGPIYTVTVSGNGEHTLSLFPAKTDDADEYRGVSSYAASPFVLAGNTATDIIKTPADLIASAENAE